MSKEIEEWRPVKGYEELYEVSDWGRVKSMNYKHTGESKIMKPVKENGGYYRIRLCKNGNYKIYKIHRLVAETFIPNPENKPEVDHIIPVRNGGTNEVWNLRWSTRPENNNNPLTKENQRKFGSENHFYGKHHTEDSKKKMSESHKGKMDGENNPFFGKHHSEESKKKISESKKGRKVSNEVRVKISKTMKGRKSPMKGKFGKESPLSKKIFQYSKDGRFIREWDCAADAVRELGFSNGNISSCCNGKMKTAYGFIWKFA